MNDHELGRMIHVKNLAIGDQFEAICTCGESSDTWHDPVVAVNVLLSHWKVQEVIRTASVIGDAVRPMLYG